MTAPKSCIECGTILEEKEQDVLFSFDAVDKPVVLIAAYCPFCHEVREITF